MKKVALVFVLAVFVPSLVLAWLAERQRDFAQQVETLLADRSARDVANRFDEQLRRAWPLAEVGFAVLLDGNVLSPSVLGRPEACRFRLENDRFFCCETVEVYWNSPK